LPRWASSHPSSVAGRGRHAGVLITAAIVLVVSNVVDLGAIASVGSACSLMVFLLVGIAGYRLRAETGSRVAIVVIAIVATAIVLVFFAIDTAQNAPQTFAAIVVIAALCVVLDLVWKRVRKIPPEPAAPLSS
jgi:amino acid transporter